MTGLEVPELGPIADEVGFPVEEVAAPALRYCLSQPAVSTLIAGMRSTRKVERNGAAVAAGPLPAGQVEALHRHRWVRSFYR